MYFSIIGFVVTLFYVSAYDDAWYGIGTIQATSISQFQCLSNSGVEYVFLRVAKADGSIDQIGLQNMENAYAGGFNYSSVVILPYFVPIVNINASQQIVNINAALENTTIGIEELYGDLDSTIWSNNQTANQQFLVDINNAIWNTNNYKVVPGYLSSASKYEQAVGKDFPIDYDVMPWLVWTQITGFINGTDFEQFGKWCRPKFHIYKHNDNLCGVTLDRVWGDLGFMGMSKKLYRSKQNKVLKASKKIFNNL